MAQDHGLTKRQGFVTLACTPFFLHFLSHISFDLFSLFHHHHVVFHKQHLGCRQHVKQKKHHALSQQAYYLKPGKKSVP